MTKLKKNLFEAMKKALFESQVIRRKVFASEGDEAEYWEMILARKLERSQALYNVIIESGLEEEYLEWEYREER